ncbi:MAG: tetratricopeptide repeat protein [Croceibacterium sp.]
MTTAKLGENIAREWSEDAQATELRDALQIVATDAPSGLKMLEKLAANGSSLAKVYLGNIHLRGKHGVPEDGELGESWLRRSAEEGSIEGAYGLASCLLCSGRTDAAITKYQRLADLKYSPALFVLGWQYYRGEGVETNLEKSLFYFKLAEAEGHFHAAHWISHIYMRSNMGLLAWLRGLTKKIVLTIPFVRATVSYPSSDRLRR